MIESKTVAPGQMDVEVGVYVSNEVDISAIVLPFEFRIVGSPAGPHAFTQGAVVIDMNPAGRMYSSPLGPDSPTGVPAYTNKRWYHQPGGLPCSGPISRTYAVPDMQPDNVSPDGCILVSFGQGCDNCGDDIDLDPGTEVPGIDTPSLLLRFDVNDVEGQFEIDTCCITPVNHLSFVDRNSALLVPSFTKGVITVGAPLENSVVVESKSVLPSSDSVYVGIWISNAVALNDLVIPLEVRSVSPGSFTSGLVERGFNPAGRLYHTPTGPFPTNSAPPAITQSSFPSPSANTCSGPVSSSYSTQDSQPDGLSPDGYLLRSWILCDVNFAECCTAPGVEFQGEDPPSYYFSFSVTGASGQFEIDTCCIGPGFHLAFIDCMNELTIPTFTKGVISVGCFCRCHGDPDCNGHLDIVDVVQTVGAAFRGSASIGDQDCTHARTDVDANAVTNILDVARMIDVVFGGESQDDVFVDPCSQ